MDQDDLTEKIRKARCGVIRSKSGKIKHTLLEANNEIDYLVYSLYIAANVKDIINCSKYPLFSKVSRRLPQSDVKAIWMYLGSDLKIVGMKSKEKTPLQYLKQVIDIVDDVARIKRTHSISCVTGVSPAVMNRLGYELTNIDCERSYYRKQLNHYN